MYTIYITALTIAGVDTLRSRREELTRRFFTRPTRAERDILSSLLAATKARREHCCKTQKKQTFCEQWNRPKYQQIFKTRLFHTVLKISSRLSILF